MVEYAILLIDYELYIIWESYDGGDILQTKYSSAQLLFEELTQVVFELRKRGLRVTILENDKKKQYLQGIRPARLGMDLNDIVALGILLIFIHNFFMMYYILLLIETIVFTRLNRQSKFTNHQKNVKIRLSYCTL